MQQKPKKLQIPLRHPNINFNLSKIFVALGFTITSGLSGFIAPPIAHATEQTCDDVQFIFARGSGEYLNDVSYREWKNSITLQMRGIKIQYSFHEIGARTFNGDDYYPAVPISGSYDGYINALGAVISAGKAYNFGESVQKGVNELKRYINQTSTACSNTKYVLGGYSQGAFVMMEALPYLDANKIIYVATFGDPKLYLPEGAPKGLGLLGVPDACDGKNLSSYRAYVPDCHAHEGILGGRKPYLPEAYEGKVATWCNKNDFICSSNISFDDHSRYIADDLYKDAADHIRYRVILAYLKNLVHKDEVSKTGVHDVAFLFDATGSMDSYIEKFKGEARKLAVDVMKKDGRVALYQYKDKFYDDDTRMICDFGCSEEMFMGGMANIVPYGGEDTYESLLGGINDVLNNLSWREDSIKTIVVLTDTGFHDPDNDGTTLASIIKRVTGDQPVNIYVITQSRTFNFQGYQELFSQISGGFFDIDRRLSYVGDTVLTRPVAKLAMSEYIVEDGAEIYLDASGSYSIWNEDLTYEWDLDGDGTFEKTGGSVMKMTYHKMANRHPQVRVTDSNGSSIMTANITDKTELPAVDLTKITNLTLTQSEEKATTAKLTFTSNADKVMLSVDDATLGFIPQEDHAGEITLRDLRPGTTITLTPYSAAGHRGVSSSASIPKPEPEPTPDDPKNDDDDKKDDNKDNKDNNDNQDDNNHDATGDDNNSKNDDDQKPNPNPGNTGMSGGISDITENTPPLHTDDFADSNLKPTQPSGTVNPPTTSQPSQGSSSDTTIFIPKAPDTGVISKSQRDSTILSDNRRTPAATRS